jgi:hypothetical protein
MAAAHVHSSAHAGETASPQISMVATLRARLNALQDERDVLLVSIGYGMLSGL